MENPVSRWRRPWWLAVIVAVVVMLGGDVPAGAATTTTDPYSGSGYDVGWPNCSETPPTTATFAIVGLGDGRPFTTSPCLASEWNTAHKLSPGLYFNTGYAGAYGRDVTSSCTTSAPPLAGLPQHDQSTYDKAWEIGCSEAAYAVTTANTYGEIPSMWWADIETGNSWSTNQTVNQYTVDGISYEMSQSNLPWGVYSYATAWDKLVGSSFTATPPFNGDWGPSLRCKATSGFSGVPVWVAQGGTTSSGVDTDTGCG